MIAAAANDAALPAAEVPRYFNRELSWLAFNRRVLEEACNPHHPLLERLRFLSISANNLDEFFMVRVAGLKAHQTLGIEERSVDGLTTAQQLEALDLETDRLVGSQLAVLSQLQESLAKVGVITIGYEKGSQENAIADGNIRGTYGTEKANPKRARNFLGITKSELQGLLDKLTPEDTATNAAAKAGLASLSGQVVTDDGESEDG